MKADLLKGLSEDQIAKVKACKTQEEILALAREEGIELTDEQLEAVSGGCNTGNVRCPRCNNWASRHWIDANYVEHECWKCGYCWKEYK